MAPPGGDNIISVIESGKDAVYTEKVKGADLAFEYANAEAIPLDDATNKRLLRKIDLRVLPWLCGLYILQYLDKGV
jgi:ACS family allantoate permease-like MFS transporter